MSVAVSLGVQKKTTTETRSGDDDNLGDEIDRWAGKREREGGNGMRMKKRSGADGRMDGCPIWS